MTIITLHDSATQEISFLIVDQDAAELEELASRQTSLDVTIEEIDETVSVDHIVNIQPYEGSKVHQYGAAVRKWNDEQIEGALSAGETLLRSDPSEAVRNEVCVNMYVLRQELVSRAPKAAAWQPEEQARGDRFEKLEVLDIDGKHFFIGFEEQESNDLTILRLYTERPIEEHMRVEVWGPRDTGDRWTAYANKPAEVNWQSIGSVDATVATAAAVTLQRAAEIAERKNREATV